MPRCDWCRHPATNKSTARDGSGRVEYACDPHAKKWLPLFDHQPWRKIIPQVMGRVLPFKRRA